MIEKEISLLKDDFLKYAYLIKKMLEKLKQAFFQKDCDILNSLVFEDEPEINKKEIEIDELCMRAIAQFQPKGKSLRIIMMISKINNDLERIADQVVNISQSGKTIFSSCEKTQFYDFSDIFSQVIQMYSDSINSFSKEDSVLARKVLGQDEIVDSFNRKIYEKFKAEMQECPQEISSALQILRIARNLERIADHCTNICEDVIYVVEGKILKHGL